MDSYDIGDRVRLRVSFTNSAGVAVDPSSVTLQYRRWLADPSSYSTLAFGVNSIVKESVGSYYHDLAPTEDGEWRYRWNAFGDNASAVEKQFKVRFRSVG